MFDKLIVSDAVGADINNRRNYFMVSSLVVGVLFLAAVVFSIFASDYGLGNHEFELVEMLPPIDMAATEPEPSKTPTTPSHSTSQVATRQEIMSRTDEPTIVPPTTSAAKNAHWSRPIGDYLISSTDSNPASNGSGRNTDGPGTGGAGLSNTTQTADNTPEPELPPVKVPPVAKPHPVASLGVINGRAADLVKPVYSAAAKAVNAQGTVEVQVMIDEAGKVVSAHAISGNALLRPSAEVAARSSKFTPTLLSNVPIKVTGVIVYNFIR